MLSYRLAIITAILPFVMAGCAAVNAIRPSPLPVPAVIAGIHTVSVEGRPIRCTIYGSGIETVLIIGGIHGSEPVGAVLAQELCAQLKRKPELTGGRRVIVAPAVNPDGLAAKRRNNAHGIDLNRNFSTRNYRATAKGKPFSEPESRYIADMITRYKPMRIITIHQPLNCVDYDGPGLELATAVADACHLPVRKLGARSGSLGSYAGVERRIPIITLELGPSSVIGRSPESIWGLYGRAMLVAISHPEE
jgi:murein peptide amidase A